MLNKLARYTVAILALMLVRTALLPINNAFAYEPLSNACSGPAQGSDFCNNVSADDNRTFVYGDRNIFVRIIQAIVLITGFISVVMVVIGGAKYVLSAGDASGIKSAKDTILYALVGLVVAIFSQGIVAFVLSRFK